MLSPTFDIWLIYCTYKKQKVVKWAERPADLRPSTATVSDLTGISQ